MSFGIFVPKYVPMIVAKYIEKSSEVPDNFNTVCFAGRSRTHVQYRVQHPRCSDMSSRFAEDNMAPGFGTADFFDAVDSVMS